MSKQIRISIYFIISLLLVGYMFYIDEGNYNFEWMKSMGTWLIFVGYVIVVFLGQVVISEVFLKTNKNFSKLFWSIILGPFLGASLIAFLLFCFVQIRSLFL